MLWLEERPSDTRGDRFCLGAAVVNLTGNGTSSRTMSWPEAGVLTQLGVRERNLARADAVQPGLAERVELRQEDGGAYLARLASGSIGPTKTNDMSATRAVRMVHLSL